MRIHHLLPQPPCCLKRSISDSLENSLGRLLWQGIPPSARSDIQILALRFDRVQRRDSVERLQRQRANAMAGKRVICTDTRVSEDFSAAIKALSFARLR